MNNEPSEQTIRQSSEPYGCKDKTYAAGYYAPQRMYDASGGFVVRTKWIPHTMTTDCGSVELSATDPRCEGCKWRKEV